MCGPHQNKDFWRLWRWSTLVMVVVPMLWLMRDATVDAGILKEKANIHVNGVGTKADLLDLLDPIPCINVENGTSGVLPCDTRASCCQPDSPRVNGTDLCCPPGSHQFYFHSETHETCACAVPPSG